MAGLIAATGALAGCGSMVADHLPTAAGGLPDGTPQRPTGQAVYPAVHDMPPPRSNTLLSDAEQKKLEDDLVAARKRAAEAAKPVGDADK
jgi:hypothetical protein